MCIRVVDVEDVDTQWFRFVAKILISSTKSILLWTFQTQQIAKIKNVKWANSLFKFFYYILIENSFAGPIAWLGKRNIFTTQNSPPDHNHFPGSSISQLPFNYQLCDFRIPNQLSVIILFFRHIIIFPTPFQRKL